MNIHIQRMDIYQFVKKLLFCCNILEKHLLHASHKVSTTVKKKKEKVQLCYKLILSLFMMILYISNLVLQDICTYLRVVILVCWGIDICRCFCLVLTC